LYYLHFFFYHLYLIKCNTTTIETFKWRELYYCLGKDKELYVKFDTKKFNQKEFKKYSKENINLEQITENDKQFYLIKLKREEVKNIYNNGFKNNLKEILL